MNIEDQVAARFAKANPVPSLDLLDPIDSVDVDSLRDPSERTGEKPELKTIPATGSRQTIQTVDSRPRRPWLTPAMATIAILVVAIPILVGVTPLGASPTHAERVANAFMDAINEHDGLAIRGMWALEDQDDFNPDEWPALTDFNRALGFDYTDVDCAELTPTSFQDGTVATPVECSYTLQQDLMRALGLEATQGIYYVDVSGGDILRTVETWSDSSSIDASLVEFQAWVQRTHPDDYWTMYSSPRDTRLTIPYSGHPYSNTYAVVEKESLALWDRYVDDFVAEVGG